jgi:HEAT repeat protein
MRVVMRRFPGPLAVERSRIGTMDRPPRPSDCGPVLRLIVRERKVALPFVLDRLDDPDPEVRGWATHVLSELPYAEAIPRLLARLRDPDPTTRVCAGHALAAIAKPFPLEVRDAVSDLAHSDDVAARVAAMHVMAELRQPALVPELVHALGDDNEDVMLAAHAGLIEVTRQDFGADARPWLRWWNHNAGRHRVEWLIDALAHEVSEIRRSAIEELRSVSKEYFGYSGDLPPKDRERAQQRYRDWWLTEGRARFRRI